MTTTSIRIRRARINSRLTIKKLSELIDVTERSVKRYEGGQSTPDTHTLIQLACIFDLSTDYLLGISDKSDTSFLDKYRTSNIYYKRTLSNVPIETEKYYWVTFNPSKEAFPMQGQMQWAGINKAGEELYCLRPIIVERCQEIFKKNILPNKIGPLIVNDMDDFYVFLIYGGDAFVTETVCKESLKHLLRPGTINQE